MKNLTTAENKKIHKSFTHLAKLYEMACDRYDRDWAHEICDDVQEMYNALPQEQKQVIQNSFPIWWTILNFEPVWSPETGLSANI